MVSTIPVTADGRLRPEFQCPEGPKQAQQQLDITPADVAKVAASSPAGDSGATSVTG
jgi:hypothetical protein